MTHVRLNAHARAALQSIFRGAAQTVAEGDGLVVGSGKHLRVLRPCTFTFGDDRTWPGFTDDTTWNGFLNVCTTADVAQWIVGYWDGEDVLDDEMRGEFTPDEHGLVSFGYGYCTTEVVPRWTVWFRDGKTAAAGTYEFESEDAARAFAAVEEARGGYAEVEATEAAGWWAPQAGGDHAAQ